MLDVFYFLEFGRFFCGAGNKSLYQVIHLDLNALKGKAEYSELVNGFACGSERSQLLQ